MACFLLILTSFKVKELDVQEGGDELLFDRKPHYLAHVLALEIDDRVFYLDLCDEGSDSFLSFLNFVNLIKITFLRCIFIKLFIFFAQRYASTQRDVLQNFLSVQVEKSS